MILSISALIPLVLIALVPFVNGSFDSVNLFPMLPLSSLTCDRYFGSQPSVDA